MHLKKLDIQGFKSFCDKTEIIFEKGVTCVVGPNGCGKSNISDAMRWVLGERSAKTLRGAKMEDVIFHGTDFRKPVNYAEVSLSIDNSDHVLPIQYDEVVITRRLDRSGTSEYFINKTLCRLKDVQDLILDTGIGSNSYSMIEQGKIDYILSAEAEERRFLIEEAAGISKFKVKKEEAIRKLDQTEQNLLRLNDIVAEVERNIKYAERQARRAEKYKVHRDELQRFELIRLAHILNRLNQTRLESMTENKALEESIQQDAQALAVLEEKLKSADRAYAECEQGYLTAEQKRLELDQQLLSLRREHETTQERYLETQVAIDRTKTERENLTARMTQWNADAAKKQTEYDSLQELRVKLEIEKSEIEGKLGDLTRLVNDKSMTVFRCREQSYELASQLVDAKNELSRVIAGRHHHAEQQKRIAGSIDKLKQEIERLNEKSQALRAEAEALRHRISEQESQLRILVDEKSGILRVIKESSEKISAAREDFSETKHRLSLLSEMDGLGFSCVKEIIEKYGWAGKPEGQAVCSLLELLDVQDGYEVAAAAVLADLTKAIVTEDAKSAMQLLHQIESEGHHRATILIRNQAVPAPIPAPDASLSGNALLRRRLLDVVTIKAGYEGIFNHLFGQVYVVDEINDHNSTECAQLADRVHLVSKRGTYLGNGFQLALRNGSPRPIQDYLSREHEKTKLRSRLTELEGSLRNMESERKAAETRLEELTPLVQEATNKLVSLQMQLERIETSRAGADEQQAKHMQEIELNHTDTVELTDEAGSFDAKELELKEKIAALDQSDQQLKTLLEQESKWVDERKHEKEVLLVEMARIQTRLENHEKAEENLAESASIMRSHLGEAEIRLTKHEQDEISSAARLESLKMKQVELGSQTETVQSDLIQATSVAAQKKDKRNEFASERTQITDQMTIHRQAISDIKTKAYESEKKVIEIDYQKNAAIDRIRNTYQLEIDETQVQNYFDVGQDTEAVEQSIQELKSKMDSIGTVNLLAIEEYEEMKQRFEFLTTQRKDLEDSKEALMEAIRKINRTTKSLFEETFVTVRQRFQEYFQVLFQGGTADLVLVDDTNPLESGIDIVARPAGKRPQHISLLSGGEKALTAVALLFALFKVKPSPFCVLDEVDAPLDEANNDRLVRVLGEFLSSTQFIIVTHSRKTIAMGTSLYGVTMEEPGVSKIVSVKLANDAGDITHTDTKIQTQLNAALQ